MSPSVEGKKFVARIHPEFAAGKPILTKEHLDFAKSEMAKLGVNKILCEYNAREGYANFYEDEGDEWMAKMSNLMKEAADEIYNPDSSEEKEDSENSEDNESSTSESHYDDLINQLKSGKMIKLPPASSGMFLFSDFDEKTGKVEFKMKKLSEKMPSDEEIEKLVKKTAAEHDASKTESKVVEVKELSEDSDDSEDYEDSDGSKDDSDEESGESSKISQEGFNLDDVKKVFEEKAKVEAEKRALELPKMPTLTTPQLLIIVLFVPIVIAFWMHQFEIDFGFFEFFDF